MNSKLTILVKDPQQYLKRLESYIKSAGPGYYWKPGNKFSIFVSKAYTKNYYIIVQGGFESQGQLCVSWRFGNLCRVALAVAVLIGIQFPLVAIRQKMVGWESYLMLVFGGACWAYLYYGILVWPKVMFKNESQKLIDLQNIT